MTLQKLDFLVQQADDLTEASTILKAGAAVTLSRTTSGESVQVLHENNVVGAVPTDQLHHLQGDLPPCTVRSVRKQDGKITQVLVRATMVPSTIEAPQLSGKQDSNIFRC